jgi:hypothetical protein
MFICVVSNLICVLSNLALQTLQLGSFYASIQLVLTFKNQLYIFFLEIFNSFVLAYKPPITLPYKQEGLLIY